MRAPALLSAAFLLLAACSSPSPGFSTAPPREVVVDGSRFRIYLRPGTGEVEAHRVSFEPLPSLALTLEKAYRAIEQATGCRIRKGSLRGDQAIILAQVDCPPLPADG